MAWCSSPSKKSLSFQGRRCCRVCLRLPKQSNMAWKTITHWCRQYYGSCPKCCSLLLSSLELCPLASVASSFAFGVSALLSRLDTNICCHPRHAVAEITSTEIQQVSAETSCQGPCVEAQVHFHPVAGPTHETQIRFRLNPLFCCLRSLVQIKPVLG